jgi:hypothetical protein
LRPTNDTSNLEDPNDGDDARLRAHAGDFSRAAAKRLLCKDRTATVAVLAVTARYAGGFDYRITGLPHPLTVAELVDFLDKAPLGTTVSVYPRKRATLRAV